MNHTATHIVTFLGLLVVGAPIAQADSVTLNDGSVLVGTIERLHDGKLAIETKFAGRLELDATQIKKIVTDAPMNVAFETGDKLVGEMTQSGDGSVMKSALGEITVDPTKVTSMWTVGGVDPAMIAAEEAAKAEYEKYIPVWTFDVEAGGVMTEGNTETLTAHGRLDLKRKTTEDLLHFFLAAQYAEQDDNRTQNEYSGGILYRQDFTERFFWYSRLRLEFDEFEDLDLRALAAAGVGYFWIKEEHHELTTTTGLGYRHESYGSGRTENDAILDLGLDYRLDILPWAQFTHSIDYTPSFDEFDDYRLDVDTALVVPFTDPRWKWKIGMRNEYNSRPQRGMDRLDNTYYSSIVVNLK